MKSPRKSRFALLAAMLVAATALGDEGEVRRAVQGKLPGVESVKKQPFGLYEVVTRGADGPQIYYTDEQASVIIAGQVFDSKTGTSLTEERLRKISTIKWQSLPFNLAVTTVRGNGRRKIAIFSDPNCPYCKKFEKDLAGLDDITVHVFLYPVIKPQSVQQTKAVWCSKDRSKAWNDLMQRDVQPSAQPDCDNPVDKLLELGHRLGANSTPTWHLENGERYTGALDRRDVEKLLSRGSASKS